MLEFNLKFFGADLSDIWEHPRLKHGRSKRQNVNLSLVEWPSAEEGPYAC